MAGPSSDPFKAFVAFPSSLEAECASMPARLAEIEAALGAVEKPKAARPPAAAAPAKRNRAKRELSLKKAVPQVTAKGALAKAEILAVIGKLSDQFTAKDPVNSLNTVFYGKKPKFRNQDGRFSPASN
jgi:hypothetical protein